MADAPQDRDALVECMAMKIAGDVCLMSSDARRAAVSALAGLAAAGLPVEAIRDVINGKAAVVPVEAMGEAEIMSHDAGSEGRKWRQKYAVSPYTQAKPACSKCGAPNASPVTGVCWSCDTTALAETEDR